MGLDRRKAIETRVSRGNAAARGQNPPRQAGGLAGESIPPAFDANGVKSLAPQGWHGQAQGRRRPARSLSVPARNRRGTRAA